jgi:hypothetical protein
MISMIGSIVDDKTIEIKHRFSGIHVYFLTDRNLTMWLLHLAFLSLEKYVLMMDILQPYPATQCDSTPGPLIIPMKTICSSLDQIM